ncbi:peptidoglycan-binding protein LysM [Paracoccus limosus]|uniref:Potassium binding protein Kbp n=1 Tax=Paracoccus limosus TaxID=913252 RepID=A0A844H074_9RHOB|nr:peptidoglycan-binding protein LysM [Paracoccus limosus]MTH34269.1 peptidoglycan-binding protein LysM [Paracoccus limosus]
MAIWDFVKDAGKSIFGGEAKAEEAPKAAAPAPAAGAASDAETDRKVAALKAELAQLGLTANDVHLTLRGGDTVVIKGKARDQETLEKLILAVGNIKGIARVELADDPGTAAPAKPPLFHTVKKGETLSAIAKQYLGDANRYREIFEANRPMLSHPDKIYPGQTLRIAQG